MDNWVSKGTGALFQPNLPSKACTPANSMCPPSKTLGWGPVGPNHNKGAIGAEHGLGGGPWARSLILKRLHVQDPSWASLYFGAIRPNSLESVVAFGFLVVCTMHFLFFSCNQIRRQSSNPHNFAPMFWVVCPFLRFPPSITRMGRERFRVFFFFLLKHDGKPNLITSGWHPPSKAHWQRVDKSFTPTPHHWVWSLNPGPFVILGSQKGVYTMEPSPPGVLGLWFFSCLSLR